MRIEGKLLALGASGFIALSGVACGPKDGDQAIVERDTTCWQYPGGESAGKIQAPNGQRNRGKILTGTDVTITPADVFGSSNFGYTRVMGNVNYEALGQSLTDEEFCWVSTVDLAVRK